MLLLKLDMRKTVWGKDKDNLNNLQVKKHDTKNLLKYELITTWGQKYFLSIINATELFAKKTNETFSLAPELTSDFKQTINFLTEPGWRVSGWKKDFAITHFFTIVEQIVTVWKVFKYGVFSGPYFPVFGLSTEI